jgi:hypothetical protein
MMPKQFVNFVRPAADSAGYGQPAMTAATIAREKRIEIGPTKSDRKSLVYFVRIGDHIKIGFTTNLEGRVKSFWTTAVVVRLITTAEGGRELEQRLHDLFKECRVGKSELFTPCPRINNFIRYYERRGLGVAIRYLERTTPEAHSRREEMLQQRAARARLTKRQIARQAKAEKDAYFAALVNVRKEKLGW